MKQFHVPPVHDLKGKRMEKHFNGLAQSENTVSKLYQNSHEASSYIENRFTCSWQKLLHESQVKQVDAVLRQKMPNEILEIAPGPARLATDLKHVRKGYMVEFSQEMIDVAHQRLQTSNRQDNWSIIHGNAFDLCDIKSLPESFEFIFTFRFIRHFEREDRIRLYRTVRKKLCDNGLVMFDVVNRVIREKIDGREGPPPENALPVYDVTYTKNEFLQEMQENGFTVVSMVPVLRLFPVQYWFSIKLFDIFPVFHEKMIHCLEYFPYSNPLEWIALCQKKNG